jgi:hypothetical protein
MCARYHGPVREELAARFGKTVAGAPRPKEWPPFALPGAIAATIEEAAARNCCPESLLDYYTRKMPELLLEQLRPDDEARQLLRRPFGEAPRLREALDGLFRVLALEKISAPQFLGASSPSELLEKRPNAMSLHAFSLFGSGLPLVGAYPADRAAFELRDADRALDLQVTSGLVHELCHGPPEAHAERPLPWMLAEAAALTLGAAARRQTAFPDEAGESVPGISLFVCLGSALARRWGRGALFRLLLGAPLESATPRAEALREAAWRDWQQRREPPFARDALTAMDWIKLADGAVPLTNGDLPSWRELPWWHENELTVEEVEEAVGALFQVNVMATNFQTRPAEARSLLVDVEACTISAPRRPEGVFAEPAWYFLPPPLCRRLWERGARRLAVLGTSRSTRRELAGALIQFATESRSLPAEAEWTFSR